MWPPALGLWDSTDRRAKASLTLTASWVRGNDDHHGLYHQMPLNTNVDWRRASAALKAIRT